MQDCTGSDACGADSAGLHAAECLFALRVPWHVQACALEAAAAAPAALQDMDAKDDVRNPSAFIVKALEICDAARYISTCIARDACHLCYSRVTLLRGVRKSVLRVRRCPLSPCRAGLKQRKPPSLVLAY